VYHKIEGYKSEEASNQEEVKNLLNNASKKSRRNGKQQKFYTIEGDDLKFKNYVGFLRIGNYQFEILPKIWKKGENEEDKSETIENFTKFFVYGMLKPNESDRYFESGMKHKYTSFLNMLVHHYVISLERELKEGPYSEYVEIEEKGKFLRGRLDLNKQINSIDKSNFHVRYYNHSYDNHLNRNLLFAAEYMEDNSLIPINKTRLPYLISMFPEDISEIQEWNFKEFHFNRLNERFQLPYNYADLIVNGNVFSHNKGRKYYSFLYDMNKLFEQFIANLIKRNSSTIFGFGLSRNNIRIQEGERNFIYKGGEPTVFTIPDIFIELSSNDRIIIDTKYQIMDGIEDNDEGGSESVGSKKVKNYHLYQLYTYSKLYNANLGIIIYPLESKSKNEIEINGIKINDINDTLAHPQKYTFEKGGTAEFKMCGISMDLSGDRKIWENRLVKNLRECLCD
jgi:McrBC 5-methylcytosine restriction system component